MGVDRRLGRERDALGRYAPRLSAAIVRKMCELVLAGNYIDVSAAATGVSKDTVHEWMRVGADIVRELAATPDGEKPRKLTPHEKLMVDLSLGIDRARAQSEVDDLKRIEDQARNGQWAAAAWRLERKYPERYGRRVAIGNADGQPFQLQQMPSVDLSLLTTDEVRELQRLLLKASPQAENVIEMPRRRELGR